MKLKFLFFTILLAVFAHVADAQNTRPVKMDVDKVWDKYERYREAAIKNRFIKHSDVVQLIQKHVGSGLLASEEIGRSIRGRSVNHLSYGSGRTKVLLWSQMHGDESTATMALFDLFNFLSGNDEFDPIRSLIKDNLELHFVPMLNPDGAQEWKRRNDQEIDINRDARLLGYTRRQGIDGGRQKDTTCVWL
jgi:murein tripeptide amidase MpaA